MLTVSIRSMRNEDSVVCNYIVNMSQSKARCYTILYLQSISNSNLLIIILISTNLFSMRDFGNYFYKIFHSIVYFILYNLFITKPKKQLIQWKYFQFPVLNILPYLTFQIILKKMLHLVLIQAEVRILQGDNSVLYLCKFFYSIKSF